MVVSSILTYSGSYFDFLDPDPQMVTIEDIAHGLSNVCRFSGQCPRFYSVAEHSYFTSLIVPQEYALQALMHDAPEALVGDVSKPLKELLPDYQQIEEQVEAVVFRRFNIPLPLHPSVKQADIQMLAAEKIQLMHCSDPWHWTFDYEPADIKIMCWSPEQAKAAFLNRYRELSHVI